MNNKLNIFYYLFAINALFLFGNRVFAQQTICSGGIHNYAVDENENAGNGTLGSTYTWQILESNFQGTITTNTITGNQITIDWATTIPGIYTLQVIENSLGCESIKNLTVTIETEPDWEIPDEYLCPNNNNSVIFTADSGFDSYSWTNSAGAILSTQNSLLVTAPGIYTITITSGNCLYSQEVEAFEVDLPILNAIAENNTIIVSAVGGSSALEYQLETIDNMVIRNWQGSNIFANIPNGEYIVRIRTIDGGCELEIDVRFLIIPNTFTPNGDGTNDIWDLSVLNNYPNSYVEIFDRYGKLIETLNQENNYIWDGKYLGRPLHQTSYWYKIYFEDNKNLEGYITIKNR